MVSSPLLVDARDYFYSGQWNKIATSNTPNLPKLDQTEDEMVLKCVLQAGNFEPLYNYLSDLVILNSSINNLLKALLLIFFRTP